VWTEGIIQDRVTQTLGFRTFSFDSGKGFLLNGRTYDLLGANIHQDREGKGWALTHADREEDLKLLLGMGGTFVRLVHFQHDEDMYDLCDRLGLVVWAEHGLVNTVSPKKEFSERALLQLTELIRQDYNHPSIVMWGIGNEVQTHKPSCAKKLMERLARRVKAEDPVRPSVLATCFSEVPGTFGVDLVGHNQYFGWYHGTFEDLPKWLDEQHAKAPDKCQGMSEYGAGAGVKTHSAAPKPQDHSEEYQALFHEAYWKALRARPWVWCKAVWQMFDSASDGRNEGEKPGINDKGLVTRDRKVKKDAYFWYKANWNPEPMLYITSRRFTLRTEPAAVVKVYSNCDKVTLTLNGRPVGTKSVKDRVARWNVVLGQGSNQIAISGANKGVRVKDSCTWFYEPKQ
jgi:beta-galactosidase